MTPSKQDILNLKSQLFPTGRAWDFLNAVDFKAWMQALVNTEKIAVDSDNDILIGMFPENEGFTTEHARKLEKRYGIIINEELDLSTRKGAIADRLGYPGGVYARQHYTYIQFRLQRAGFNVFVHENRFPDGGGGYETVDPIASKFGLIKFGGGLFGTTGVDFSESIKTHIDTDIDGDINITNENQLRATFFIGGESFGDFADVPQLRKDEFRQLILKLKPCHCQGWLQINYI